MKCERCDKPVQVVPGKGGRPRKLCDDCSSRRSEKGQQLVTFYVPNENLARWDTWCKSHQTTRTRAVRLAMDLMVEGQGQQQAPLRVQNELLRFSGKPAHHPRCVCPSCKPSKK
jgi:hypothetical protein